MTEGDLSPNGDTLIPYSSLLIPNSLSAAPKIVVLSNGYCPNTEKYLKEIGIDYISLAYKPLKKSFKKAITDLNLAPDEIFMIGDDYFSDIYGGSRNKLKTILVDSKLK